MPTPARTAPATTQKKGAKQPAKDPGPRIRDPIQPLGARGPKNTSKATSQALRNPKEGRQLILKIKRGSPILAFNSLMLRNQLNEALGALQVLSIEPTARGNLVIIIALGFIV